MNLVNPYIFAPPIDLSTNTEIGGVASTISTPALLAAKLSIDVSRITNFSIVGSDIKCKIVGGSYFWGSFFGDSNITYYDDKDGLFQATDGNYTFSYCSNLKWINIPNSLQTGYYVGRGCPMLKEAPFPNATKISGAAFYESNCDIFYIPRATNLGGSVGNNQVFNGLFYLDNVPKIIYCHPSLATNNGGNPDGDLANAIYLGATVRYVTNFTAPNPVTTLSAGTIYNTAIQLNFTPPSSTNDIEYYECYADGVLKNTITASGQYITGLTPSTSYNITLIVVDIFYNKSVVSNSISVTTDNETWDITTGLVSYYKLDSNSNDSFGSNNGTDTSVSYVAGKVGNAGSFNGTTSKITANFAGAITTKASINFWIKLVNHTPSDANKTGVLNITNEPSNSHYPFTDGSIYCGFFTNSRKTIGAGIVSNRTQWHMVTVTADSVSNVWKFYQNGTLVMTSTVGSFTMLSSGTLGKSLNNFFLDGQLDETAIYNTELTQIEIDLLYNSGNGITL